MEKVNFKNPEGLNLVGNLHIPEKNTNSLILMIHGFTSNKDRPRFVKAAEVFSKNGFAALRFDCSGCGESDDSFVTYLKARKMGDIYD
jgi:alpha/beta superfamily hydrolase